MATVRKVGAGKAARWRAEVRRKGCYRSKRFDTKLAAQRWALEQEHQIGARAGVLGGYGLRDAFERYAREVSPAKKGARWEQIRLAKFGRDSIADRLLAQLTADDIAAWRDRRLAEVTAASVNREMTLLSAVVAQAKEWRWIDDNVVRQVKFPAKGRERERRISDDEIGRVLAALGCAGLGDNFDAARRQQCSTRLEIAIAFLFAIETAMRQGEIWGLTWGDVDLNARYCRLPDTKNGDPRNVPLSQRAVALLRLVRAFARPGPRVFHSSQASAGVLFRRAVELAGIDDLRFHDTRHEACSRIGLKVPDALHLSRITGHRDPRMLRRYFNPTVTEMAAWLD